MKGKRYTTEDKIRILREADSGEGTIQAIGIKRRPDTVMKAGYSRYGG